MKELNKNDLFSKVIAWASLFKYECSHSEDAEWTKEDDQAVEQIKQLISQERQVDEEFIEKKAKRLNRLILEMSPVTEYILIDVRLSRYGNFIRSMLQEIQEIQKPEENDEIYLKIEKLKEKLSANQKMYPLSYPNFEEMLSRSIKY